MLSRFVRFSQPAQQSIKNFGKSFEWKRSEAVESANGGKRRYTRNEKSAGPQNENRYGYFEGRTAQAGGVRNDGNECAVLVSKSHADYQGGTSFPHHTEIDQPDLTAARGGPPIPPGTCVALLRQLAQVERRAPAAARLI